MPNTTVRPEAKSSDDVVADLRARLVVAQQRGDEVAVRSIVNQIDDIFVSRNWRHADDQEIRRLRRALRAAP